MGSTITERVRAFRQRPGVATFYKALSGIVRQRRLVEVAHGAGHFMLCKPSIPRQSKLPASVLTCAERLLTFSEAAAVDRERSEHRLLERWIPDIAVRPHSVAVCGEATIVGEYCETGARIFMLTGHRMVVSDHYCREPGVQHIHLVHAVDNEYFLVSTGDSRRLLDLWRIDGGQLRFERRLMRRLAGFTGVATVRGETYLGSDFSSRPNYLLRLRDRRKFFLPREAFLRYVWLVEPVDDRYLIVGSKTLEIVGGMRSVSIFDAAMACFVEPR